MSQKPDSISENRKELQGGILEWAHGADTIYDLLDGWTPHLWMTEGRIQCSAPESDCCPNCLVKRNYLRRVFLLYPGCILFFCLRFAYAVAVSAYAGLLCLDLPMRAYAYHLIFDFAYAACIWCFCGVCILSCLFMFCLCKSFIMVRIAPN